MLGLKGLIRYYILNILHVFLQNNVLIKVIRTKQVTFWGLFTFKKFCVELQNGGSKSDISL